MGAGLIRMRRANLMAAALLTAVSLAHLLRWVFGVEVTVAGRIVPMWVSAVACVVAGGLAYMLWRGARRG